MVMRHIRRLGRAISAIFKHHKNVRIGIYGPVNAGKTTLANRICMDWLCEELGAVSEVPHETREIQMKERVTMERRGKKLTFKLVDTPGIATKIDFEDFLKYGLSAPEAKKRAKEATRGVIEAIKWLDQMDLVLVVMDAAKDPLNQVNVTILGNLDARDIPVVIVANKTDLKEAKPHKVREAFPNYTTIGVSAKSGKNVPDLYEHLFKVL